MCKPSSTHCRRPSRSRSVTDRTAWCSSIPAPEWRSASPSSVSLFAFPPATQLAKTTLFASGNEADVRQTRRSAFGRPEVDPKGAVQGGTGTKSAAGDFFQLTHSGFFLDDRLLH